MRGCKKWIHKKCSGVKGKLKEDPGYRCAKCVRGCCAEGGAEEQEVVLEDGSSLECDNRFCYLGDMLGAAGGCGEASRTRVRGAWGQFKEFAELLTRRGIPLRQKGRVYRTCVQSVMVYASETWAIRVEEEQRMERNENVMLRWMCGVTLKDKVPTVELRRRLGIEGVVEVMRRGRLRWFGHVEQKEMDDWVSACRNLEVVGSRGRGRPKMTWRARLDGDMKDMGLRPGMAMDREMWRCGIMGRTSDPHKRGNSGR